MGTEREQKKGKIALLQISVLNSCCSKRCILTLFRKILADFKMGGPIMVSLYSSGPNNGCNGF